MRSGEQLHEEDLYLWFERFDFAQSIRNCTSPRFHFHQDINPYLLYEIMEKADFQAVFDALLSNNNLYIFEVDGKKYTS